MSTVVKEPAIKNGIARNPSATARTLQGKRRMVRAGNQPAPTALQPSSIEQWAIDDAALFREYARVLPDAHKRRAEITAHVYATRADQLSALSDTDRQGALQTYTVRLLDAGVSRGMSRKVPSEIGTIAQARAKKLIPDTVWTDLRAHPQGGNAAVEYSRLVLAMNDGRVPAQSAKAARVFLNRIQTADKGWRTDLIGWRKAGYPASGLGAPANRADSDDDQAEPLPALEPDASVSTLIDLVGKLGAKDLARVKIAVDARWSTIPKGTAKAMLEALAPVEESTDDDDE